MGKRGPWGYGSTVHTLTVFFQPGPQDQLCLHIWAGALMSSACIGWSGMGKRSRQTQSAGWAFDSEACGPFLPSFTLRSSWKVKLGGVGLPAAGGHFFQLGERMKLEPRPRWRTAPPGAGGPPASLPVRESEGASQVPLLSVWIMFQLCFCHETTRWSSVNINK